MDWNNHALHDPVRGTRSGRWMAATCVSADAGGAIPEVTGFGDLLDQIEDRAVSQNAQSVERRGVSRNAG